MTTNVTIRCGEASIAAETGGAGETVVFLHAGVADRRMWRQQLTIQEDFAVAAYDRRGFGETVSPDETFSHVQDLGAVLDQLGVSEAILVGCSQGGRIAVDYALAHPERVKGLFLSGAAISGAPGPGALPPGIQALMQQLTAAEDAEDRERVNEIEAHLWLDGPQSRNGRIGGVVRDLFLDMNRTALQAMEFTKEVESPLAYAKLGTLQAPTLVMWGDLDFPHVQQRCEHLVRSIPGAQPIVMTGTAHLPNLEQPETFSAHLRSFVKSLSE